MTISANVRKELFEMTACEGKLIRIRPTDAKAGTTVYTSKHSQPLKMWTQEEHERFLEAMERYPSGPWKVIATFIGTKTTRQTMTHAQKYRQKISRWRRGLRHKGRKQTVQEEYSPQFNCQEETNFTKSCQSDLSKLAELASEEVMKPIKHNNSVARTCATWRNSYYGQSVPNGKGNVSFTNFQYDGSRWRSSTPIMVESSMIGEKLGYCRSENLCSLQDGFLHPSHQYQLPSIHVSTHTHPCGSVAPAIPPLRSKINPTVLMNAHEGQTVAYLPS